MTFYCVETTCNADGTSSAVMKGKIDSARKPISIYMRVGDKDVYTDWLLRDGASNFVSVRY